MENDALIELHALIVDFILQAVAVADAALRSLYDLYAAGASNGMDPGPLAAGGGTSRGGGAGSTAPPPRSPSGSGAREYFERTQKRINAEVGGLMID